MRDRNAKEIPDLRTEVTTKLLIQQGQLHGSQKDELKVGRPRSGGLGAGGESVVIPAPASHGRHDCHRRHARPFPAFALAGTGSPRMSLARAQLARGAVLPRAAARRGGRTPAGGAHLTNSPGRSISYWGGVG
jgi:hypothetical protein